MFFRIVFENFDTFTVIYYMVTETVDAYVDQDLELARKVMAHDDVVDDYFAQVKTASLISLQQSLLRANMRWIY